MAAPAEEQLAAAAAAGGLVPQNAGELLELLAASQLSPNTARAYGQALRDYARFREAPSVEAALAELVAAGAVRGNTLVLRYRTALVERRAAPATINQRLSALKTVLRLGRMCGLADWFCEVRGVPVEVLRDTSGPGRKGYRRMLRRVEKKEGSVKAARDRAILELLGVVGLREAELLGIDLADVVDHAGQGGRRGLWIRPKGRLEKSWRSVPAGPWAALAAWLAVRPGGGEDEGVFVSLDRRAPGRRRLTPGGLRKVVARIGEAAGVRTRPHGLRHLAITVAIELAAERGYPITDVLAFSGHAPGSLRLLITYRDRAGDAQGAIAALVGEELGGAWVLQNGSA